MHQPLTLFTRARLLLAAACAALTAFAAEPAKKSIDLPADTAERSLKRLSDQAGVEVVFATGAATGVRTNAVKGSYAPLEAARLLLAGTALAATQDRTTGALLVNRTTAALPNVPAARAESTPVARAAAYGTFAGRVSDATTGRFLENALVTVEGLGRETRTDEQGEFSFAGLPAGEHRVRVAYTGLDPATVVISTGAARTEITLNEPRSSAGPLRSAAPATADSEAIIQLDAFSVSARREMSAADMAINEKRAAGNIKEVVSTEAFGALSQDNIGEFLKYVAGVAVDTGDDISPTTITLRGVPADQTNFTVDGLAITIPQTAGTARTSTVRGMSLANVSRIEITKVPTPDMRADSLGGSVNLVSRSSFERRKPEFNFKVFTLINGDELDFKKTPGGSKSGDGKTWKARPNLEFNYVNPLTPRLGIAINGSQNDYWAVRRLAERNFTRTNSDDANPYTNTVTFTNGKSFSSRTGLGTKLDYRLRDSDTLSVTYNFNRYWHDFGSHQMSFFTGPVAPLPASGVRTDATGNFGPTFTLSQPAQAVGVGNAATVTQSIQNQFQTTRSSYGQIAYRHRGDLWQVDSSLAKGRSTVVFDHNTEGRFQRSQLQLRNVTIRLNDLGAITPASIAVRNAAGQPVDVNRLDSYSTYAPLGSEHNDIRNNTTNARVDVTRKFFSRDLSWSLKAGAAHRSESRDREQPLFTPTYLGPDGRAASGDEGPAALPPGTLRDPHYNYSLANGFPAGEWLSTHKAYSLFLAQPGYFSTTANAATDYTTSVNALEELTEAINAYYLMADVKLLDNKLRLVGGARYERTEDFARGTLRDNALQFQQDASGKLVKNAQGQNIPLTTDPLRIAQLTNLPLRNSIDKSYGDFYPSLNATYEARPDLIVRAGYARTIGRPAYFNLIPTTSIAEVLNAGSDATGAALGTITARNPTLTPWTADNYDVSVEFYTRRGGLLSAGWFRKDIADFFDNVTEIATPAVLERFNLPLEYLNYQVNTARNADATARLTGLEFSARQQLVRGLAVFANGSFTRITGSRTAPFQGFLPKRITAGVNFNYRSFSATANAAWTGKTRGAVSPFYPNGFNYILPRTQLDGSLSYHVTRRLALYASGTNLFNARVKRESLNDLTPAYARLFSVSRVGPQLQFGVKGDF